MRTEELRKLKELNRTEPTTLSHGQSKSTFNQPMEREQSNSSEEFTDISSDSPCSNYYRSPCRNDYGSPCLDLESAACSFKNSPCISPGIPHLFYLFILFFVNIN